MAAAAATAPWLLGSTQDLSGLQKALPISTHIFNSEEDVDRVVEGLDRVLP